LSTFGSLELTSLILIFCAGLAAGVFVFLFQSDEDRHFLLILFLGAFLLRIFLSVLLYNLVFLRNGAGLFGDGLSYSENGYSILQIWVGGVHDVNLISAQMVTKTLSGVVGKYDFWNAMVYFFSGKSPLAVIFINCLAGSLTAIFVFQIAKSLYDVKSAKIAAILTAFWPSLLLWSMQNLKEPISTLLLVVLMWSLLLSGRQFRIHLLLFFILASIALREFRNVYFYAFYMMVLPVALVLYGVKKAKAITIITVFAMIILVCLFYDAAWSKIAGLIPRLPREGNVSAIEWIHTMRTYRTWSAKSAFLANFDITQPGKLFIFAPAALFIALLAPFPWQVGSMLQLMALPEMLIYYSLIPAFIAGIKYIMSRAGDNRGAIVIGYILVMIAILAFLEGNVGTLFRHRAAVLPFMFILIGIGLERKKLSVEKK